MHDDSDIRGSKKKLEADNRRSFAVMLANHLGILSVDEMLSAMTPAEFMERVAFFDLEATSPVEKIKADDHAAVAAMGAKFNGAFGHASG